MYDLLLDFYSTFTVLLLIVSLYFPRKSCVLDLEKFCHVNKKSCKEQLHQTDLNKLVWQTSFTV